MSKVNKPNSFGNRINSRSYVPIKMSESKIELSSNVNMNSSTRLSIGIIGLGVLLGAAITVAIISSL
jgi:hypothetical protein